MKPQFGLILGIWLVFSCQPSKDNSSYDLESFIDPELFKDHIRTTDFQTPEEEMAGFHLPSGFEINLYASEPDITKPINMEFDDRGRLWVTHSIEYPNEASSGSGKDKITILEDTDGDGKADRFTDFASDLNIPIGIMPVKGGALAFSIPNIYFFEDKNGDDRYDEKRVVLGPFGHEDTHGMVNNFMRGLDGWVHASHGFRNTSKVAGTDGDSIQMISGNTFRFKLDGTRVEQTTYGRVNPFGFAVDDLGNLYSADCHSMPIYQLISQGEYPHFGKKAPGLGFAPAMMDYQIGSTALSGLEYYQGGVFPEEFQNSFYSGDVVACRVSRNTLTFEGSSPVAVKQKDFLVSEDPWFRPVDIKIGPDGALYVADFYNRIIGHYEVPLDHPGRDRTSGRIWRITYKGQAGEIKDWSKASLEELVEGLGSNTYHQRLMASNRLVDFHESKASRTLESLVKNPNANPKQQVHALWVLKRLNALSFEALTKSTESSHPEVRIHAYRILSEFSQLSKQEERLALKGLTSSDPHVRKVAANIFVKHPKKENLGSLLKAVAASSANDTHLQYTLMIALRNHLMNPKVLEWAVAQNWKSTEISVIMDALTEVPYPKASEYLFEQIKSGTPSQNRIVAYLGHVGRYIPEKKMNQVISFIKEQFKNDAKTQYSLYHTIQTGIGQRGGSSTRADMKAWAISFAGDFLKNLDTKPEEIKDLPTAHVDEAYEYFEEIARQQVFASQVASDNKLKDYEPGLRALFVSTWAKNKSKSMAAKALLEINPNENAPMIEKILTDAQADLNFREELAKAIGNSAYPNRLSMLGNAIKDAPTGLQVAIASVFVHFAQGRANLLQFTKEGSLSPRILLDRRINEQLLSNLSIAEQKEYLQLTGGMESLVEERQKLIDARLARFGSKPDLDKGKAIFVNTCNVCHQIDGQGGIIGPQLDGIGNWGKRALAEKILDPNRNISQAFKTYTLTTKDGKVQSGLFRRDEGQLEVYANASGQEFSVAKKDIQVKKASQFTLMPDSFGESISEKDFDDLIGYLLSQK